MLAGVYIPQLTTNIISLGELEEDSHKVVIEKGILRIRDQHRHLLVKVQRSASCLYILDIDITQPVCLAPRSSEVAW